MAVRLRHAVDGERAALGRWEAVRANERSDAGLCGAFDRGSPADLVITKNARNQPCPVVRLLREAGHDCHHKRCPRTDARRLSPVAASDLYLRRYQQRPGAASRISIAGPAQTAGPGANARL